MAWRCTSSTWSPSFPDKAGCAAGVSSRMCRSAAEIAEFAKKAIEIIDAQFAGMDAYLESLPESDPRKRSDAFFIEHDRMLLRAEKQWIEMAVDRMREI